MADIDDGGAAFPVLDHNGHALVCREFGMTLRDWFAGRAGDPPKEFVAAYKDAHPMGRIRYTYGNSDEDGALRKHDLRLISEYHASIRSAWATSFADAMLAARNNTNTNTNSK